MHCGFLHEGKNNNNSGIFFVKDSNHQRSGKLWMLFVEKLLHKNRKKNIQICNVIYCIYIEGTEGLKAYMHFKNVLKNCNEC